MIEKILKGNIFWGLEKHIAFGINKEGINCSFFAEVVSNEYWPELFDLGQQEIGSVVSKEIEGKFTLHALVCYSYNDGWAKDQGTIIKTCLDSIELKNDDSIACHSIGDTTQDVIKGAKQSLLLEGIRTSSKKIRIYHT